MGRPATRKLDASLLPFVQEVLAELIPQLPTERKGKELSVITATHSPGEFKINTETGMWADFTTDDAKARGRGVVSLVAHILGLPSVAEAVRRIEALGVTQRALAGAPAPKQPDRKAELRLGPAPEDQVPGPEDDVADLLRFDGGGDLGLPVRLFKYRDRAGQVTLTVARYETPTGKETRPWGFAGKEDAWVQGFPPGPRPIYRTGDLSSRTILIGEGEKVAEALAQRFSGAMAITTAGGCGGDHLADIEHLHDLFGAAELVAIYPDNDKGGAAYALRMAARAWLVDGPEVLVADLSELGWADGDDMADHPDADPPMVPFADLKPRVVQAALITAAAELDPGDLGRARKRIAEKLELGLRDLATLLKPELAKREDAAQVEGDDEEPTTGLRTDAPWDGPVDGEELVIAVHDTLARFVYLPEAEITLVAAWVMHSYLHHRVYTSPILMVTSPAKRCGKSTLLEVLAAIVPRPMTTSNLSSAVLFRAVEAFRPTLLIDEADTFLRENPELGGILNAGHRKSQAVVYRVAEVDGQHIPAAFSVWAPKVVAGIGAHSSETLVDRSIIIKLARRPADAKVERVRPDELEAELTPLRAKLTRWAQDCQLSRIDDTALGISNDRMAQNAAELVAAAAACGPTAEAAVRAAVQVLQSRGDEMVADTKADLLADLRPFVEEEACKATGGKEVHLTTAALVKHLVSLEDRPWRDLNGGKGITGARLARELAPFDVRPVATWVRGKAQRAYPVSKFVETFARYLATEAQPEPEPEPET